MQQVDNPLKTTGDNKITDTEVLVFGDLHINSRKPSILYCLKLFMNFLMNSPFNNENNIAIFLGDTLDKCIMDGATIKILYFFINKILKFKKIYFLQGNHEIYKRDDNSMSTQSSSLECIKVLNRVEVIENPQIINIVSTSFLLLPFLRDQSRVNLGNLTNCSEHPDYILGHVSLNFDEGGYDFNEIKKYNSPVYIGHIHNPLSLVKDNIKIQSIGSVYPTRFGENDEDSNYLYSNYNNIQQNRRSFLKINTTSKTVNILTLPIIQYVVSENYCINKDINYVCQTTDITKNNTINNNIYYTYNPTDINTIQQQINVSTDIQYILKDPIIEFKKGLIEYTKTNLSNYDKDLLDQFINYLL